MNFSPLKTKMLVQLFSSRDINSLRFREASFIAFYSKLHTDATAQWMPLDEYQTLQYFPVPNVRPHQQLYHFRIYKAVSAEAPANVKGVLYSDNSSRLAHETRVDAMKTVGFSPPVSHCTKHCTDCFCNSSTHSFFHFIFLINGIPWNVYFNHPS